MECSSNYKKHTEYKGIRKILINRFNKNLIKVIKEINPVSILDAGCGEGFIIKLISDNVEGELKICGFDLSEQAAGFAEQINKDANIKAASIYDIPFENNSFDLVICSEVLEHLEKPEEALKETNRVAKRDIILSVPHEPLFSLENLVTLRHLKTFGNNPEHVQRWGIGSFRKLARKYLGIKKSYPVLPWIVVEAEKK